MRTDFNSYADAYARNRSIQPNLLRSLLAGAALVEGDRVLEIGCGTGNYLAAVVAETGATGYGIDPSQKMLDQVRSDPARANLKLTEATAEALPFPRVNRFRLRPTRTHCNRKNVNKSKGPD